ncbi:MAG: DUF4178 domain-containing protein, partial [Bacteroidota bacterium]
MAGDEHKPRSPIGGLKAFSCRNCGGQVKLRVPGQTLVAAFQHCGAVIDLTDENLRIIQEAQAKKRYKPGIPLGTRGTLADKEWEVVGFMVRKASGYQYYWEEYLLYNPWYGFTWLMNSYGHWSFVVPMMDLPELNGGPTKAKYNGRRYQKFTSGGAEVVFVLGEFYWQIKVGDSSRVLDLINPPHMLSLEMDEFGKNWSQSMYMEPEEVKKAFNLQGNMPIKLRVGANQPNHHRRKFW